jgi:hypothetical protein
MLTSMPGLLQRLPCIHPLPRPSIASKLTISSVLLHGARTDWLAKLRNTRWMTPTHAPSAVGQPTAPRCTADGSQAHCRRGLPPPTCQQGERCEKCNERRNCIPSRLEAGNKPRDNDCAIVCRSPCVSVPRGADCLCHSSPNSRTRDRHGSVPLSSFGITPARAAGGICVARLAQSSLAPLRSRRGRCDGARWRDEGSVDCDLTRDRRQYDSFDCG